MSYIHVRHFLEGIRGFFSVESWKLAELECCLTVENLKYSNGVVTKRRTYKSITVVLGRDEFHDIALRIVSSQSPLGKTFLLKEMTIHKRFVQEGKATIKLLITQKIQIMFSNCPPNQLAAFLKCLSLKLAQASKMESRVIRQSIPAVPIPPHPGPCCNPGGGALVILSRPGGAGVSPLRGI